MKKVATILTVIIIGVTTAAAEEPTLELEALEVKAALRESELEEMPASISLFDAANLNESGAEHFQDLIALTPNLSYSGGTARPQFLQIRGIGELDQYDEPVIPSVGFIIDDIDFSGIGGGAGLFDIQQAEVLRGPQGSIFGANAMAGLVNLRSSDPTPDFTGRTLLEYGSYNSRSAGLALGGPLTLEPNILTYRLSLHQHISDGYMENETLGRDDTNDLDEFTGRLKLRWKPSSDFTLDLTGMYLDFDNGYDAFSFEDDFKTQTNDPGHDKQRTAAASARATWNGASAFELLGITAAGDTDSDYRFDADWGTADDYEQYVRNRKFLSQELRLSSKPAGRILADRADWLVGVYAKQKDEHTTEHQRYGDWIVESVNDYRADVLALYGQIDYELSDRLDFIVAARGEHRDVDYDDTYGAGFNPRDDMYGGNLSLQYTLDPDNRAYATIARGYKGSGFNPDPATPPDIRVYDEEHIWNYETGLRSSYENFQSDISIFYTRRSDPQIKWWDPGPPWVPYTINGEKGYNYGLDADLAYSPVERLRLFANLGLLRTKIYSDRIDVLREGREDPHAPTYQYATGADLRLGRGYVARLELVGSDGFEFDYYYNAESDPYHIVNARLSYESEYWTLYLWGRNVFDEVYAVRGLNLGEVYTQKGAPATIGCSLNCYF